MIAIIPLNKKDFERDLNENGILTGIKQRHRKKLIKTHNRKDLETTKENDFDAINASFN